MEWFYTGLAGIQQAQTSVGYKEIIIKPEVVGNISFVKGSYESVYGTIKTYWEKKGDEFLLDVEVPANATAIVYLPAKETQKILEDNKSISDRPGIKWIGFKEHKALVKIGSGSYHFTVH